MSVVLCLLRHLLKEQGSASAQGDVVLTAVATAEQEEGTCSDLKSSQSLFPVLIPEMVLLCPSEH